eukprot:SAG31_NODE_16296_length_714_cov_1.759350_1_plen_72_part_10
MGKYKRATNEERREKAARQQTDVCALLPESHCVLRRLVEVLAASAPQDHDHRDRGPAVKLSEFLHAQTLSKQ